MFSSELAWTTISYRQITSELAVRSQAPVWILHLRWVTLLNLSGEAPLCEYTTATTSVFFVEWVQVLQPRQPLQPQHGRLANSFLPSWVAWRHMSHVITHGNIFVFANTSRIDWSGIRYHPNGSAWLRFPGPPRAGAFTAPQLFGQTL